jgi:hypothetical protein
MHIEFNGNFGPVDANVGRMERQAIIVRKISAD